MSINFKELFKLQARLDNHVVEEKGLSGVDLFENKLLAFNVELGELANEWRGFKHWVVDPSMRRDSALEEYADCLHFALSIGLELGIADFEIKSLDRYNFKDGTNGFIEVYASAIQLYVFRNIDSNKIMSVYGTFLSMLIKLGLTMGFTEEEIVESYKHKNEINHQRQNNGY